MDQLVSFNSLGLHYDLLVIIHQKDWSDLKIKLELRHQWSISTTEKKLRAWLIILWKIRAPAENFKTNASRTRNERDADQIKNLNERL